jgi:beta-lactamase regulating signal transducer with metallopeptidase domain
MYTPPATFLAPADSARVIGDVYSVSLLATLPVLVAMIAFVVLRRSNAGTRVIVWRSVLVGLLMMYAGRLVPWQWMAWVLPELLARPLVALGTVHLDASPGWTTADEPPAVSGAIRSLMFLYWSGVVIVVLRAVVGRFRLAMIQRHALKLSGSVWRKRIHEAGEATHLSTDRVQLFASTHVPVPMTWGLRHPVILLPKTALRWPADRLQAVLRHELIHVRASDAAMRLTSRIACALFWFHPGVWWLARRFEADAESACDDRVLLSGVRASDYAEWLAASASETSDQLEASMALARRSTLRSRLSAVIDTSRHITLPSRRAAVCTALLTVTSIVPLATVRLAPTRHVLTSLMNETRWESRAWAVVRLAQRADSVDVARSAARHDPDPSVRAWARYALSRGPSAPSSRSRS